MDTKQWYKRHTQDAFVAQAQLQGYRSRASYKLIELVKKYNFLVNARSVIDLGAAPGSWSQVARNMTDTSCSIIALDYLEMQPIDGVTIIRGDFTDISVREQLEQVMPSTKVNVILSDMSPNLTGITSVDQLASANLVETAVYFCRQHLQPSGTFVTKLFHGSEFEQVLQLLRTSFKKTKIVKPKASRSDSKEVYMYAQGLVSS